MGVRIAPRPSSINTPQVSEVKTRRYYEHTIKFNMYIRKFICMRTPVKELHGIRVCFIFVVESLKTNGTQSEFNKTSNLLFGPSPQKPKVEG